MNGTQEKLGTMIDKPGPVQTAAPAVHSKAVSEKYDHPSRHPDYERAVKAGKERLPKLKFENEAAKRDYLWYASQNENNVPGLPEFFPPVKARSTGFGDGSMPQLTCGHKAVRSSTKIDTAGNAVTTLRCGYGHVEERKGL